MKYLNVLGIQQEIQEKGKGMHQFHFKKRVSETNYQKQ